MVFWGTRTAVYLNSRMDSDVIEREGVEIGLVSECRLAHADSEHTKGINLYLDLGDDTESVQVKWEMTVWDGDAHEILARKADFEHNFCAPYVYQGADFNHPAIFQQSYITVLITITDWNVINK